MGRNIQPCIFIGLAVSSALAESNSHPPKDQRTNLGIILESDLENGLINADLAALYRYYALFDRDRLPDRYLGVEIETGRCATPIVRDLKRAWPNLAADLRATVQATGLPDAATPRGGGLCDPDTFPFRVNSDIWPVSVHYQTEADGGTAAAALVFAEEAWQRQVVEMGFIAPLPDEGLCGGDSNLDILLQHGVGYAYTIDILPNDKTEHDDYATLIVIDPDAYGDVFLETTVAHEFNHALQAADDWWEVATTLESTATFIEEVTDDDLNYYPFTMPDFNRQSERPFEYNDFYAGYYLYGGVIYLLFLRDRYLEGDESFVADMWFNTRSPYRGTYGLPHLNEPDLHDAVTTVLMDRAGVDYRDSVIEFSRWRWFVGINDDGAHFEEGGAWPNSCGVKTHALLDVAELPTTLIVDNGPRTYGVWYIRLDTAGAVGDTVCATFSGDTTTAWHVETMRRGDDLADEWHFELFDGGTFATDLSGTDQVLFKVLNLATEDYDPDYYDDELLGTFTLELSLDVDCPIDLPCDGDVNADGAVDPLDAGYVLSRFGCAVGTGDPTCDAADANTDTVVDPLDVGYVQSRFGMCEAS